MSTVVSDIIRDAYRESNLIALSASPTTPQANEGLTRLQSYIRSVLGNEVGYDFEDWTVTSASAITKPSSVPLSAAQASAWVVNPQARLQCSLTVATELDLDPYPTDGQRFAVNDVAGNFNTYNLTLNGNGRKVNGGSSLVISTDDANREFFYRADLGDWIEITDLSLTDEMPFPQDFDDFFTTGLAMRINPRYGREIPEQALARYVMQRDQMIKRYDQQQYLRQRAPENKE